MANTNLENASSGRPIITSNIHGCLEAVQEGNTGFLVNKRDVDDLYHTMKKFIELSYDEKKNMGVEGRKYMKEKFEKIDVVNKTLDQLI